MAAASVIEAYSKRPDWWVISREMARDVGHSPGVQFDERTGEWIIHRNLLPLLPVQIPPAVPVAVPSFGDGVTALKPRQTDGYDFVSSRRGSLEADAMRLGKTGICVASHDPDDGPMIVVGPLATRPVWQSWFARRWPDEPSVALTGLNYDRDRVRDAKLVFVHYDVLPHWLSAGLYKIGTLVFDEAHKLSNRKSRRTQAALVMAPQASRIICATGTPLWNKPQGLYSLLTLCNPGAWGTFSEFTARYCQGRPGAHGWLTGDADNVDEFRARLREVMIRRVWADVLDELIPTQRKMTRVAIPAERARELDLIAMSLSDQTDYKTLIGQLARYRRLVGTYKGEVAAVESDKLSQTGPVVCWVWHKSVADCVAKKVKAPSWVITGKVLEHKREEILNEWRACPNGVLIMSLSIGQAGIDLSHASQCIFAEIDWTPAVLGQAEMRTFSPERADDVLYIVADHDIDLQLVGVLAAKCEQALLLGTPAADTAIDVLGQALRGEPITEADLAGLAARMAARVRREGTTFV